MTHEDWMSVARAEDPDDVRERILTGYRSGKPFTPYVPTIAVPAPVGSVLDFGCGLGRNFPYLVTIARDVVGFDLPPMVERCRALATHPLAALMSDWGEVRARRFDLVFATLVLQHIEPAICRAYLDDFARIAPLVYVLTRVGSDFNTNVLDMIADSGLFDAGPCVAVEHDPESHQLRVLGRGPLDAIERKAESGHYEFLLQSRGVCL